MPISFGRKSRARAVVDVLAVPLQPDCRLITEPHSRLIDVRSPQTFRGGFIPGSFNAPDVACMAAARRMGLFEGRQIFLLADEIEQLQLYSRAAAFASIAGAAPLVRAEVVGWFGPEAIEEWGRTTGPLGSWRPISRDQLASRAFAGQILPIDISEQGEHNLFTDPAALRFSIGDLPAALDGLPVETPLCLTAFSDELASFAASIVWNFGFHQLSTTVGADGEC